MLPTTVAVPPATTSTLPHAPIAVDLVSIWLPLTGIEKSPSIATLMLPPGALRVPFNVRLFAWTVKAPPAAVDNRAVAAMVTALFVNDSTQPGSRTCVPLIVHGFPAQMVGSHSARAHCGSRARANAAVAANTTTYGRRRSNAVRTRIHRRPMEAPPSRAQRAGANVRAGACVLREQLLHA